MKLWHFLTVFLIYCVGLYFRPKIVPQIAANYYIVGSERVMNFHDSIRSMEYDVDDSVVVMVRFDDTIRIAGVTYVIKIKTIKYN